LRREVIGKCKLYLCDCMDLMAQYPDKYFDLAIVDPPYGGGNHKLHNYKEDGNWKCKLGNKIDGWDIPPDASYFNELFRVSPQAIIWGGNNFTLPISKNFIIWYKPKMSGEGFSMAMAEYAWTNTPGNSKVFVFSQYEKERIHPTQKPVALYKWLLSRYAKQGDKILDTHFGSGSIAIACYDMGFSLTACEIDGDCFTAAVSRLKLFSAQGTFDFKEETA
jgi:site-specific DNA-methyltransferase (adenine-specific)